MREFLFYRVYWDDLLTICDIALEAARRSAAEARNHVMRAQDDARKGIDLAEALNNPPIQSYALNALDWCYLRQQRFTEAVEALRAGLPFARQLEEAVIEGNLSLCNTGLGNYEQALVHAGRSLAVHRSRQDPAGEALALHRARDGLPGHRRPPRVQILRERTRGLKTGKAGSS